MRTKFAEELETLDFAHEPETARQQINGFVANVTEGNIKDILQSGQISEMTRIVLANAAFFRGQWAAKFNKSDTKQEIFYSSPSKHVFVEMMHRTGVYSHGTVLSGYESVGGFFFKFCFFFL